MKRIIIIFLLISCFQALSGPSKQNSFLFTQIGHDRDGISFNSRFHINNEGRVIWETVSRGDVGCPSEAGTYDGVVGKEKLEEFIKLGSEEIYKQRKIKVAEESSSTYASITTWKNGVDLAEELKTWNDSFSRLSRNMALVQGKLKPLEAIKLNVKVKNNKVKLYVKNIGKLSFNFLLPENASDAFLFDNSYPAKYSKNQKHGQFKINPGKELVVNLERPQNAKTISYTNSQIKHFSSDELMEEVFVCAKI
jgi:hypothetical protein